MNPFVISDLKRVQQGQTERKFPDDEWILEVLEGYTPGGIRNSKKSLEDWQAKNIVRREQPRGRWRIDDVAAMLIMRMVNKTHQRGWLPEEKIEEDEPRWWCYGKAPGASILPVPLPLQACDAPLFLWTYQLGATWSPEWHLFGRIAARWSRLFASADEIEVWHPGYAAEIGKAERYAAAVATKALQYAQTNGTLLASDDMQVMINEAIQQAVEKIRNALLQKAAQLMLEEQIRLLS
jgi:hypothetical protein